MNCGVCLWHDLLFSEEPVREAAHRGESARRTTFTSRRSWFPGPFGIELTLDLREPTNNPVKNLLSAAVILYIRNPNRLRRGETGWTRLSHNAQSGKHFYRLPRISTQVPAGSWFQGVGSVKSRSGKEKLRHELSCPSTC
jgi:hypothetical protein